MKGSLRGGLVAVAVAAGAASLAACSGGGGGGGFLGIDPGPNGDIQITDATSGSVLTTSANKPYVVAGARFPIGIYEQRFGGPYSVTSVGVTNVPTAANGGSTYPYSFSGSCFTPHFQNDANSQTNVWTFSADNANGNPYAYPSGAGPSGETATAAGNPCHSGLLETWEISDSKGHTVYFYDEEP